MHINLKIISLRATHCWRQTPTFAARMPQMATDILFIDASSNEHRHSMTSFAQRNRSNVWKKKTFERMHNQWSKYDTITSTAQKSFGNPSSDTHEKTKGIGKSVNEAIWYRDCKIRGMPLECMPKINITLQINSGVLSYDVWFLTYIERVCWINWLYPYCNMNRLTTVSCNQKICSLA